MYIVLFGAPGVGKGTQAELLSTKIALPHFSTGEAFRQAIKSGSELGLLAKNAVESGMLVPDDAVNGIVQNELRKSEYSNGCIFDGFPRTLAQADNLEDFLRSRGEEITIVIDISVPNKEIIERLLQRGRKDDIEETIETRLNVYNAETKPLLKFYSDRGVLQSIDGNGSVDDVNATIISLLPLKNFLNQ